MSILLASTALLAQLCYQAEHDLGSHEFLNQAQILHAPLNTMIKDNKSGCIDIKSESEYEEALQLIASDASDNTLILKNNR